MAKQRFERTRRMQVTRLLLGAAIVWSLGVSPIWAGGQAAKPPLPNAKTAQTPGPKTGTATPVKPAQTPAQRGQQPPGPKTATPTPVKPAQTPAQRGQQIPGPRTAGATPVRPAQTSAQPKEQTAGPKTAKTTPVSPAQTPASRKATAASSRSTPLLAGTRDPFKLPEVPTGNKGLVETNASTSGGILPPGARGLLIAQLKLEGVVREEIANKMIAVVTNETKRAYFLSENESVYNGVVSKITPDAVYFKENVLDAEGRVTTREVVKRLSSAPGEGR